MKLLSPKLRSALTFSCIALLFASCTTAYDAQGRPQTVVSPEGAVIGALAVGAIAYGVSQNNPSDKYQKNPKSYNNGGDYNYGYQSRDRHYQNGSYNQGYQNRNSYNRGHSECRNDNRRYVY